MIRPFLKRPSRDLARASAALGLACLAASAVPLDSPALLKILSAVFDEVKELGPRTGEMFIKWDFFIGSEDDDDTNKDRHVAVMIHDVEGGERMSILLTRMMPAPNDPGIRTAGESKHISCLRTTAALVVLDSDLRAEDAAAAAREILTAVRNKKRLLRERTPHAPR